jgi:BirA family biotin operon repressor/biotin-[acetyl-CoA-carboxylase] ligase
VNTAGQQGLIGNTIYYFPELGSTNTYAQELLTRETPPEGTIILTDHQTRGTGQAGRQWISPPRTNLTMTVILYPDFLPLQRQFMLVRAFSLACRSILTEVLAKKVQVKWPNDIYVSDRKLGGILIQNTIKGDKIQATIAGIGVNVNQTEWPSEIQYATSLKLESSSQFDIRSVQEKICSGLELYYQLLREGQYDRLVSEYLDSLWGRGVPMRFLDGNEEFEGAITGVNAEGLLQIDVGGQTRSFHLRDVTYIRTS